MVLSALLAAVGLQALPAYAAYPVSHFGVASLGGGGIADGTIIWYNRTVELQGFVQDSGLDATTYTTAEFRFFAGSTPVYADPNHVPQIRSDPGDNNHQKTPFHFSMTYDHPGGITLVHIEVRSTRHGFDYRDYTRSSP